MSIRSSMADIPEGEWERIFGRSDKEKIKDLLPHYAPIMIAFRECGIDPDKITLPQLRKMLGIK